MIILITSNQAKLLPTILSRTKMVRFSPLKTEEILEILKSKGVPEEKAKALALLAEGSMCIPNVILNNEQLYKFAKDMFNLLTQEEPHFEGIVSIAEQLDKLDTNEIRTILSILDILMHKGLYKKKVPFSLYENYIDEAKILKKAIEKGVKKKLALEGFYLKMKT